MFVILHCVCDCILCIGELVSSKNIRFPRRFYWYLVIWVYALNLLIVGNESVNSNESYFIFTWFPGMATLLSIAQIVIWIFAPERTPLSILAWIIYIGTTAGLTNGGQNCISSTTATAPIVLIAVWTLCVEVDVNFLHSRSTEEL